MTKRRAVIIFAISGAIGLMYQIVWVRMLLLLFGVTTHSIVTVLSVFMAGLAIGSIVFGFVSDRVANHIKLWSILEIFIGISAAIFLLLFPTTRVIYAPSTLLIKFIISSALIFPATFFLGGTLPVLIKSFSTRSKNVLSETSIFYLANTLGAFFGSIISAFLLIELFGLFNSIVIGIIINLSLGIYIFTASSRKILLSKPRKKTLQKKVVKGKLYPQSSIIYFVIFSFFLSGAISFSYEILWTRLLIPTLGTMVYAFAVILSIILLGIAIGALLANSITSLVKHKIALFGIIEFGIGFFAVLSLIFLSDISQVVSHIKVALVFISS